MRWDSLQELGSAAGLSFLFAVYRALGRWPFRVALAPTVLWFFIFKPRLRRASRDYLGRVLERPPGLMETLHHFFSFGEAALDKLIAWNGGFSLSDVEFHGLETLSTLLSAGRGCVLIVSHLGNAEIGRVLAKSRQGLELHVLTHTRHAENFNRVIKRLDPSSQINLYQVAELDAGLAARLSDRVQGGAVVVLAGDRVPIEDGHRVSAAPFLGGDAAFPQGPFILAAALRCPVFLFFCLRRTAGGDKKFDIFYEPFEDSLVIPRRGRDEALRELVGRYARRLEHFCGLAPYEWYNFYPFWHSAEAHG